MVLVFSLLGSFLVAMDKSKPLLKKQQRDNMQESGNKHQRKEQLKFEQKRLSHALSMDRESYLQRYGTPEEHLAFKYGHELLS